ncbi:MAG: hypothetical protein ACI959_001492, partial [Limisphaerales bacterium]
SGDDVNFRTEEGATKTLKFDNVPVGFELDTVTYYELEYSTSSFGPRKVTSIRKSVEITPLIGSDTPTDRESTESENTPSTESEW